MVLNSKTVLSEALENAFSLKEYTSIIETIRRDDFKATPEFRKKFNGFYTVRQKKSSWYDCYYSLMEKQRIVPQSFEVILRAMYEEGHTIEVSFVSKLIAAVDPNLPIWDQYVIKNLGFMKEWERYRQKSTEERIQKAVEIYNAIINWYSEFLSSENGKLCVERFDETLPEYKEKISDVKKIDYWLWSKR